jgi:membrane-associated phospholipid phosphatase
LGALSEPPGSDRHARGMVATGVTDTLPRRLVARRLYPVFGAVILAACVIGTWLALDDNTGSWAAHVDREVGATLTAHVGGYGGLMRAVSRAGTAAPVLLLISASALAMLALKRLRGALLAVLAPSIATLLTDGILKPAVGRTDLVVAYPRVHVYGAQAYPSGHTTAVCAVAFVVVVLALDQRPRRLPGVLQVAVCGVALALAGCVGVALVAAGYHVATDVAGGVCVALATVLTSALVIDLVADRCMTPSGRSNS